MNHYVLTRAVYDPELWDEAANRRRFELMRGITARSLAAQEITPEPFEWVVQVHPGDPLLNHRRRVVESVGGRIILTTGEPPTPELRRLAATRGDGPTGRARELLAVAAYRGWAAELGESDGLRLTTRIDDDDAFAPGALRIVQERAARLKFSGILVHPTGFRVYAGRYDIVRHDTNAWQTYAAFGEDNTVVYDYPHRRARAYAPLIFISGSPQWLWVRHEDALSDHLGAAQPLTREVMDVFPIEWGLLPAPARTKGRPGLRRFK